MEQVTQEAHRRHKTREQDQLRRRDPPAAPPLLSVSSDGVIRMWDTGAAGAGPRLQQPHDSKAVVALAVGLPLLRPGGSKRLLLPAELATTGSDRRIVIWGWDQHDVQPRVKATMLDVVGVTALTFATIGANDNVQAPGQPVERWLAAGCDDGKIRLWPSQWWAQLPETTAASGKCDSILSGHTARVVALASSTESEQLYSGSHDHTARVWDLKSKHCLYVLQHKHAVSSVAIEHGLLAVRCERPSAM
eukprot:SAG31_NODE_3158_length_4610_cov_2.329417_3_plen_248_part_00